MGKPQGQHAFDTAVLSLKITSPSIRYWFSPYFIATPLLECIREFAEGKQWLNREDKGKYILFCFAFDTRLLILLLLHLYSISHLDFECGPDSGLLMLNGNSVRHWKPDTDYNIYCLSLENIIILVMICNINTDERKLRIWSINIDYIRSSISVHYNQYYVDELYWIGVLKWIRERTLGSCTADTVEATRPVTHRTCTRTWGLAGSSLGRGVVII
jgi:hypothetical protein